MKKEEYESPNKDENIDDQVGNNEEIDYSSLTVAEIKAKLDEKGIEYPTRASKNELIELLKGDREV